MNVMKFGGTSVGRPERMAAVAGLVLAQSEPVMVVLSALSGTTNALETINQALRERQPTKAEKDLIVLRRHYDSFIAQLFEGKDHGLQQATEMLDRHFGTMNQLVTEPFSEPNCKLMLAQGELMSTQLFTFYLEAAGKAVRLLPALSFMYINEDQEPVMEVISTRLEKELAAGQDSPVLVTQGYICRNSQGEVDNLRRGGSDYTASLVGAAMGAQEIQIWTDIDGMHNNDPRVVDQTKPISQLSFEEAAELAYFGAKILHPSTILPAQRYNIPVRLKNTMAPDLPGTIITSQVDDSYDVKAVAAKEGITAIKIKSSRMLLAYGFMRQVFQIFEKYRTPIDMITTSEVAVSLTIDDETHLPEIQYELSQLGVVEVDREQCIVCIVGRMVAERKGVVGKVFQAIGHIPLRMVSYGGSKHNISVLLDGSNKVECLQALNKGLFGLK